MFFRKRVRPPLYASLQTRNATPIGAMGFAFYTPWRTPVAPVGTGVICGMLKPEQGPITYTPAQQGVVGSFGGVFAGTYAQQPLSDPSYIYAAKRLPQ